MLANNLPAGVKNIGSNVDSFNMHIAAHACLNAVQAASKLSGYRRKITEAGNGVQRRENLRRRRLLWSRQAGPGVTLGGKCSSEKSDLLVGSIA